MTLEEIKSKQWELEEKARVEKAKPEPDHSLLKLWRKMWSMWESRLKKCPNEPVITCL